MYVNYMVVFLWFMMSYSAVVISPHRTLSIAIPYSYGLFISVCVYSVFDEFTANNLICDCIFAVA